jgi:hypothetical protein
LNKLLKLQLISQSSINFLTYFNSFFLFILFFSFPLYPLDFIHHHSQGEHILSSPRRWKRKSEGERERERDEKITRAKTIKKQKELRKQLEKSEGRKEWAPNPKRCRQALNIMKKLVGRSPPLPPSYGSEFANWCLSFSFFSAAHSLVSLYEVCCPLRHP